MGLAQYATHIKKSNQPSLSQAYFVHAQQHQTQNHLEATAWNAQQHRESWPTLVIDREPIWQPNWRIMDTESSARRDKLMSELLLPVWLPKLRQGLRKKTGER